MRGWPRQPASVLEGLAGSTSDYILGLGRPIRLGASDGREASVEARAWRWPGTVPRVMRASM
jgi:hypothetical protein